MGGKKKNKKKKKKIFFFDLAHRSFPLTVITLKVPNPFMGFQK